MFGIKTRPIFPKILFNYKTYGNLSFHPCHKYQEQPPSSGIYFFKANNGTAKKMCLVHYSGVSIVDFEQVNIYFFKANNGNARSVQNMFKANNNKDDRTRSITSS